MELGATLNAGSVLAERARALVPLIDEYAEFADEKGELAPPVVDAFHRDGLVRDVGTRDARWVGARPPRLARGDRQSLVRRRVCRLGADGRRSVDRNRCGVPRRRGGRGDLRRRRSCAGDRRPGHPSRCRDDDRGRLPAHGRLELRLRHQARNAHPHARHHQRDRRAAHLRRARREGDADRQLGRHRAPRHRAASTTRCATCSCRRASRTSPSPRHPNVAATCTTSGSSASPTICHSGWAMGVGRRMLDELASMAA